MGLIQTVASPSPASWSRIVPWLRATSFRPSNWDIYYFAAPGAEPERLTDSSNLDYDPVFSPDGRWVVFTSERRGSPDLFAISLDEKGAAPHLLIESGAMEDQAAFSPDGRDLAFVSTVGGSTDIYRIRFRPDHIQTMNDAENLTATTAGEFRPAYSPDGTRIAFTSDRDSRPRAHPFFPFARAVKVRFTFWSSDAAPPLG